MNAEAIQAHRKAVENASEESPVRATRAASPEAINEQDGTIEFMITTPDVDAWGDIVVPQGMDNERFRKNPVVQWNHDYYSAPIARSLSETVETDVGVRAVAQFAREEMQFADMVFRLYMGGFLNAVSIGFMPKKMTKREEEKEDGTHRFLGFQIDEWMLLEYSPVPIPANENALVMAASGIFRVAEDLGIPSKLGKESRLASIMRAESIINAYPELAEKDGLRSLVAKEIERAFTPNEIRQMSRARSIDDEEHEAARRSLLGEEILEELLELNKTLRVIAE